MKKIYLGGEGHKSWFEFFKFELPMELSSGDARWPFERHGVRARRKVWLKICVMNGN